VPAANAGVDECLRLAKRWLTTCSRDETPNSPFIPTRLIDVGTQFWKQEDDARLVSLSSSVNYVALSYCWCTDSFLTTNPSNIKTMQRSIPLPQLPQTIQDAIKIVRFLGLRYLWVDSLCILQGASNIAQKDWLNESKMMGNVYQSAFFTIAAESAASAQTGILTPRLASNPATCILKMAAGSPKSIYLQVHHFTKVEVTEPLQRRGWTLQESLLSQRLLRFGTHEISWQCACAQRSESVCEIRESGATATKRGECSSSTAAEQTKQGLNIYKQWQTIVEDYSGRLLTKNKDKLVAIAGLAKYAQEATQDEYTDGIWAKQFVPNLLWRHAGRKLDFVRSKDYLAPTWSWASVEGSVQFLPPKELEFGDVAISYVRHCRDGLDITIYRKLTCMPSIRCRSFGSYYRYECFSPWAHLPPTLETYLDDLSDIPSRHKRGGVGGDPLELIDTFFLPLAHWDHSCVGLIIIPFWGKSSRCWKRIGMLTGLPAMYGTRVGPPGFWERTVRKMYKPRRYCTTIRLC
jgi:hypothetical protein